MFNTPHTLYHLTTKSGTLKTLLGYRETFNFANYANLQDMHRKNIFQKMSPDQNRNIEFLSWQSACQCVSNFKITNIVFFFTISVDHL